MATSHAPRPVAVGVLAALVGALVAIVLGFLTFGVQATLAPKDVPLAIATSQPQLAQLAQRLTAQGGDDVEWTLTSPNEARQLLADKEVYGVLELEPGKATVRTSGAINPTGTQLAQQILTGAAQGLAAASAQRGAPTVEIVQAAEQPASPAGRTAPLAASALLWIAGLVAAAAFALMAARTGRKPGVGARLVEVSSAAVVATGVAGGFVALWDSTLNLDARTWGFLLLVAFGFAAIQGGVVRLLGIRALAILAPLYLMAPAVAGQIPELLNSAYRVLLWSWTPFRFSSEGLRSLLFGSPEAPDVTTAIWVFAGLALAGLVVLVWPSRRVNEPPAEPGPEDAGVPELDRRGRTRVDVE
ncbi:ABC transporter permease [Tenggerimyces flavus]|uniref:ABC transporter permease n=1 Tax=Tenggerimyces flavus TaxID=1708749 RepID=A0ABV7YHI7_9ACTN|nr:hypothetical protein [Tenggerimyces flavus]MBM7784517.1 hypothetical protein [Tenggerimyces flavus]